MERGKSGKEELADIKTVVEKAAKEEAARQKAERREVARKEAERAREAILVLAQEEAAKAAAAQQEADDDDDRGRFFRTLTPQMRASFLYEYCIVAEKKISETVHDLFIIGEHYSKPGAKDIENLSAVSKLPMYFPSLSREGKATLCYNFVADELSLEALPVTVESLRATKRTDLDDPWSSYAGRFVKQVTRYVVWTLVVVFLVYFGVLAVVTYWIDDFVQKNPELIIVYKTYLLWVAFGCVGALLHLLNHALTTTRALTFEVSEARKIWPRILLGGMLGFIIPWICMLLGWIGGTGRTTLQYSTQLPVYTGITEGLTSVGAVIAFFGGYSVRFSIGFIERALSAVFPETKK